MASTYKTPSLDEMSDAYDAQQAAQPVQAAPVQAASGDGSDGGDGSMPVQPSGDKYQQYIPTGWKSLNRTEAMGGAGTVVDQNGEVSQIPFNPALDSTPGFFGALKDAYNRSSLAEGHNAFNNPNIFESLGQTILHRTAPKPDEKPKGFFGKLGQDAIAIGAGLPIALSHPIDTAKATLYGGTASDDTLTRLKKGAIVESIGQVFDKQYYKDHPGLAAVNTGSWIATVFSFGLSKVLGSVVKVGVARGIEEAALTGAEHAAVNTALETATKSGAFRAAATQAIKSGDTAIVGEIAKQALVRQGIEESAAASIAGKVAEGMTSSLEANATKIKFLNGGAHPISTLSDAAGAAVDPLKKLVFGETPNSAVGRLYGAETVAKNPQGFLDIEKWASQQAVERGLKDTVANRESIMTDWSKTVSEWSVLSPEERVQYHQNYVRASELAQQVAKVTGDAVVPTKFLPPTYVDAIKQTIANSPESMSPTGILDELQSIYGNDIKIHRQSLDRLIAADPTRDALTAGIEALGNRETLSYNNLPEANALVKHLEETTGYRLVEAPTNKPVSYATQEAQAAATQAAQSGAEAIPEVSQLTEVKTKLGQMIDRLGLSPTGGNEGSLEYLFQDNFNQSAVKDLSQKYGATFTANHETIPFSKLYDFLDARRKSIFERKDIAGSVSQILAPGTGGVVDMTVGDLVNAGIAKPLAEDIVKVSKKALTDIPFEKTGLADGIANFAKAHVPGYSQFMKVAMNGRFNINPFYGLQAWIEMEFNKATALGAEPKAVARAVSFGERTDARIGKILEKIPYLKDTINPPLSFPEIKMVSDELLGDIQQNTLSAASNPEMAMLMRGAQTGGTPAEMQAFAKSIQSKNVTFRAMGYTTQRAATGFAKALAEKFGFSLEEALGSKMVNGQKVYNNPEMFNMLREATSDLAGYKPGFLTSPLAKTMNVIWFPFRFQAKTIAGVAEAVSKLPPITRIGVMSDWTHFSNWAQTPEGIKYRQENTHNWLNTLNYVFTWESSGRAINDVLNGRLFGGNTGQIGGLPFGFVSNIMQDLGITPDNPQAGSKGYSKKIPKNLMSPATAAVVIEDLIAHVFPKMPFYSFFNGNVSSAETYVKKNIFEGVYSDVLDKATGGTGVGAKSKFQRTQFKTLRPGDTRF